MKQYTRSLIVILRNDYPNNWPQYMDQCMQYVSAQGDDQSIITGLTCLKILCQRFEYE